MIFLLQHIIDQVAESYPDHPLFVFDENRLTYAEFVAQTNSLAHMLIDQGVKRGDRVGIHLHKSMESVIAVYGILKAGAAFVPLDPALTLSRLAYVIQDCGIRVVISQKSKLNTLNEIAKEKTGLEVVIGAQTADVDLNLRLVDWTAVNGMQSETPPSIPGLMEQDLAYIMYTSGSTGNPKGLMHTHASGLSYAKRAAELYGLHHGDILSNHSPLHFDMSTFDIYSGPLAGATTVIIPEEYKMLPASLSELIQDERISVWYSVTTALVELLLRGDLDNRNLEALRWVNFGGEPFPPTHLTALMAKLPQARFSNVYGPAEVNQCTYFHVPPLPNKYEERYVPIGHVWDIADWLVLDEAEREVEPGETGELLIAAPTRMAGYWNQPELTDRGFYRQKPYPGSPFEKIFYRTGDLVQLDEDNLLKFLGRKDRQIKVRGYRVELDEIEATLTAHPAVAEVAAYALKRPDLTDGLVIGAAVLPKRGMTATREELMEELMGHVAQKLPAYACPRELVIREYFPRTGSGKINRRALMEMAEAEHLPNL